MTTGSRFGVVCVAMCLAGAASVRVVQAQEGRLEMIRQTDGWTAFQVATKEDVQICDGGRRSARMPGRGAEPRCTEGSVRVLVKSDAGGRVVDLEHRALGSSRGPVADADLGRVRAGDAAAFLLALVPDAVSEVAEGALGVAAMIDSVTIWPDLERFATDRALPQDVRKAALFWLGQAAADEATRGITAVLNDSDEKVDIKEAAVFALSQRPGSVAVPLLIEVAESAAHPDVRRSAFFWLSQHADPRVVPFFRGILSGE